MGSDGNLALKVVLSAVDSGLSSMLQSVGGMFGNLSPVLGIAAEAAAALGSAIIGIGVQAVQAASQFQTQMNSIQALTGANSAQMAQYDAQLKQLAINAGVAPAQLASGLYNVLSAGYQGAQAMQVLTLATEDAKIGLTNAGVTTNALTNILASFSVKTKDVTRVNGEMLETVTLGKATFEQYANTITKAASASTQFHVSMETMNAAWATLTSSGISAGQATTDYSQTLSVMYGNIGTVTASLQKNGIAFNETKFNAMSFGDKVQYLNQVLQIANDKHVHITGVTKQAAQAIQTISQHIGTYNSNLAKLSNSQAMAQKTGQAWAITQSGFAQQMSRIQAAGQVLLIDLGQKLLPILTKLAAGVVPIVTNFTNWLTKSGVLHTVLTVVETVVKSITGFIGKLVTGGEKLVSFFQHCQIAALSLLIPLGMIGAILVNMAISAIVAVVAAIPELIAGFIAWAAAAGAAAIATLAAALPVLAIGAAIGVLIAIIILLWQHWSQVTKFLQSAWQAASSWLMNAFKAIGDFFGMIWQKIVDFFRQHIALIIAIVTGPLGALVVLIVTHWQQITQFFQNLWKKVVDVFTNVKSDIGKAINTLWNAIVTIVTTWPGKAVQWGKDMITGFINGIKNMAGGIGNAVQGIGNTISKYLHFSKPDSGPLASADKWMDDFGTLLSSGLTQQVPKLQAAVNLNAKTLAGVGTPPARPGTLPSYGQVPVGNSYSSNVAGGNTHNGDIIIQGAGRSASSIVDEMERRQNLKYRRSGVMGNRTSGGKSN